MVPSLAALTVAVEQEKSEVVIGKVNGPTNPQLLKRFDITYYPVLVLFTEGQSPVAHSF